MVHYEDNVPDDAISFEQAVEKLADWQHRLLLPILPVSCL